MLKSANSGVNSAYCARPALTAAVQFMVVRSHYTIRLIALLRTCPATDVRTLVCSYMHGYVDMWGGDTGL